MSNHYSNYDIIVVNDGSTDDSLQIMIDEYHLKKVEVSWMQALCTKPIRGAYRSEDRTFDRLLVLDKENGGKSDALNAGLNASDSKYVLCVDVDCVLIEDALQRMVKPFLDSTEEKVIATGGVIGIGNACEVKGGRLVDVNLPRLWIERAQILEYLRSFLLGRMAWGRLNGLLVISGAFGLFDRRIVIEAGGYDVDLVGEDMELIVRMRRYMEEHGREYKVSYIPDPLCWTEAPDNFETFVSQRNRWTRGTIETLRKHRKIGFNRKYGALGLLSYPYWFIYERLGPVIEFLGFVFVLVMSLLGEVHWLYSLSLLFSIYVFSVLFSIVAILTEELSFHQYRKPGDGWKLLFTALLEPFFFHPVVVYAAIKGNYDYYMIKDKHWGKMVRKGMGKKLNLNS